MTKVKKKFDIIGKLLKMDKYDVAYRKLNQISEEQKDTFGYVKLQTKYLMAIKEYEQVNLLLLKKKFDNYMYQVLWCNYYYEIKNIQKMQEAVDILISLSPPEKTRLNQLEKLSVLKSDFMSAANYVEDFIKITETTNFIIYNKLLNYLYEAKDFNGYISRLENILKNDHEFSFFSSHNFLDCLHQIYDEEEFFKYIMHLVTLYPEHSKLQRVLKQVIMLSDIMLIKDLIQEEDKEIIKKLNIRGSIKKILNLDNNLNDFKREVLDKSDEETSDTIIVSPYSYNAQGTIIVFSGLAMQATLHFEILDRYFAALNLNAIYVRDLTRTLYLDGISGHSNSIDTAVEYLKNILAEQPTNDIFTLGISAGGMASIIYGNKLNARTSLSFSPPSNIAHPSETRGKLLISRMKKSFSEKQLDIRFYLKDNRSSVPVEIFYGENMTLDKIQIQTYLNIENVKVNVIKGCDRHDVLNYILERKDFMDFLSQTLSLNLEAK